MTGHLALIPARQGSSGCPGKNMADLGGHPLIWHSINLAKKCGIFEDIAVTSDWSDCLKVARDEGVIAIERPLVYATGESPVTEAVRHALQVLGNSGKKYKTLTMLNPTNPFRIVPDVVNLHDIKRRFHAPCALTVKAIKPILMVKRRSGVQRYWHAGDMANYNRQRRQPLWVQNGAVYIVDCPYFLETGKLFGEKTVVWSMPDERSLDIDTPWDLLAARAYHAELERIGAQEVDVRQHPELSVGPEPQFADPQP